MIIDQLPELGELSSRMNHGVGGYSIQYGRGKLLQGVVENFERQTWVAGRERSRKAALISKCG